MEINLNYVHSENIGYGRLGVKLAEALQAKGVVVYDGMPTPVPTMAAQIDSAAVDRTVGTAANVCWVSLPTHATGWWDTQATSVFTMWESMRLPEAIYENLHHFDTVLVPSDQNIDLFSRYHPNVKRVLLGVDPAEWYYVKRQEPAVFFDFLIGGTGTRKGTDLALEAFTRAFPTAREGSPIPRLTFKNPRGEDFAYDGRVTVIAGMLDPADEQALYRTAHCYLQPSRGEGFGLQPLQAMAQGIPTILTDAHGHESFAHLGHGISATAADAAYFIYGDAGEWWEPNLDELVDQMRWVYQNYEEACAKAKVAAEVIARDFTWGNTADQFIDALGLDDRPFTPGTWVQPSPLKFRIRLMRDWRCDIAGRRMIFRKGVDYYDLADVKRIFAEAGNLLDPECVDDDQGLTDEQIAERRLPVATGDPDVTLWHAGVGS